MMRKRKGQTTGSGAALLLAIIAGMILLYTLFLPPAERAKLLEDIDDNNGDNDSGRLHGKILLLEDPGRLDLIKKDEVIHKISAFNLVSFTEGTVIKEFDSVHVEKSAFTQRTQNLQFEIKDPKNTGNVILSFVNSESSGRLIVSLNGNIVSEKKIDDEFPTPISLPQNLLSTSNFLQLSVSSPGILFFLTNKYTLENVKIVGDTTDTSGLENSQSFFVSDIEKENLEKTTLSFMTYCSSDDTGSMDIFLNNQRIYSGIPDCEVPIKLELSPDKLLFGENNVRFSAEKGSYVIDQAKFLSNLKDEVYQTYYFEVEENEFEFLEDDDIDINMSIIFVKNRDFQDVEVEINGRKFSIDNKERIYSEAIDPYLREGNNAISLRPLDSTVEIVELKIFIIDNDIDD